MYVWPWASGMPRMWAGIGARLALVAACLCWSTPAWADEANDRKAAGILLAGFGFAASVDMLQTSYCLGAHTCTEANPLLGRGINKFGVVPGLSIKGAVHTASIYLLARHRAKAPRAVKWAALGLLAAQTAVDVHNYRQMRGVR